MEHRVRACACVVDEHDILAARAEEPGDRGRGPAQQVGLRLVDPEKARHLA